MLCCADLVVAAHVTVRKKTIIISIIMIMITIQNYFPRFPSKFLFPNSLLHSSSSSSSPCALSRLSGHNFWFKLFFLCCLPVISLEVIPDGAQPVVY